MKREDLPPGRQLWAGLELLDHQIVDANGHMAGKVDDLELELPEEPDSLPFVTAILSGLGGLAGQIGGETGKWLGSIEQRISHPDGGGTGTISFGVVSRIGEHVEVSVPRESLDSNRAEQWARDVIVNKIPGAQHEAD
jgi:hypothetical protein